MIAHLWSSTIVLALALMTARWMPRLTARTRHAVLFLGLAKLVIPAVNLPMRETLPVRLLTPPATLMLAAQQPAATPWRTVLIIASLAVTLLLIARGLLLTRRLTRAALAHAASASPREYAALDAARRQLGLRTAVDLVRSPIAEAPALLRVVRPVIVLPANRCDDLGDDELRAILMHECAHVLRRDNLLGVFEMIIASLYWFHPLAWMARAELARTREQSCDESVAALDSRGYLNALEKICRAALARPVAGVSCMASAHLSERIEHLMNFESKRSLSHRLIVGLAAIAVGASTLIAGNGMTTVAVAKKPFTVSMSAIADKSEPQRMVITAHVMDHQRKEAISEPRVMMARNSHARTTSESGGLSVQIDYTSTDNDVTAHVTILRDGTVAQEETITQSIRNPSDKRFTGEPISLSLQNADIRNLLNTFSKLTGAEIVVAPEVQGKVSIDVADMPWDEAFDQVVTSAGARYHVEGGKIYVTK